MRPAVIAIGVATGVVTLLLLGLLISAMGGRYVMGIGVHDILPPMPSPSMMLFMVFRWAVIIGGIILVILWSVRRYGSAAGTSHDDRALSILRERYARGEIGNEEYEQMRRTLE